MRPGTRVLLVLAILGVIPVSAQTFRGGTKPYVLQGKVAKDQRGAQQSGWSFATFYIHTAAGANANKNFLLSGRTDRTGLKGSGNLAQIFASPSHEAGFSPSRRVLEGN